MQNQIGKYISATSAAETKRQTFSNAKDKNYECKRGNNTKVDNDDVEIYHIVCLSSSHVVLSRFSFRVFCSSLLFAIVYTITVPTKSQSNEYTRIVNSVENVNICEIFILAFMFGAH